MIEYQVYEKYSLLGEVGAAVNLGISSLRYLQSLGFDVVRAKLCPGKFRYIQSHPRRLGKSICSLPYVVCPT